MVSRVAVNGIKMRSITSEKGRRNSCYFLLLFELRGRQLAKGSLQEHYICYLTKPLFFLPSPSLLYTPGAGASSLAMPLNAGLLLRVLTLGVLVVPILGLKFNFTQVDQCGPAVITFTGNSISTVPASLTILPLNSTAIDFPLQNPDYVSSGISLSPLPLVAGTIFLASLDNASGENLIPISDLIRVLPSEDSGCLSRPDFSAPRRFSIGPTVAQCEDLTIRYDTSVVSKGPAVRLYAPRGVSFLLGQTADDPVHGIATYTLNAIRGIQVLFLIDDGSNIRETSPLLTGEQLVS